MNVAAIDKEGRLEVRKADGRIVLESDDGRGTLFPVNLKVLAAASTVFSGIIHPSGSYPAPIVLSFASTAGLQLFLQVIDVDIECNGDAPKSDKSSFTDHIAEAVRIAKILDVESFGERVMERLGSSHTCGLRYAVGKVFGIDTTLREYHPKDRAPHIMKFQSNTSFLDLSFPLGTPEDRAAVEILEEHARAEDVERLTLFRDGRKSAINVVTHCWSIAQMFHRPVTIKTVSEPHSSLCEIGDDLDAFKACVAGTAPLALAVLAASPSRSQRFKQVGKVVHDAARGCQVCEDRLKELYVSGLRLFNAQFPEMI